MTDAQKINAKMDEAIPQLRDFLSPFVASISSREPHSTVAKHFGSGSFARMNETHFLLSNAHVLGRKDLTLGIVLKNNTEMHTLTGAVPQSEDADLAITEIPAEDWDQGDRRAVDAQLFNRPHDVPDGEICFFMGFPGAHSFSSVAERTVRTRAFPYAGQKVPRLTDDWVFYVNVDFKTMRDEHGQSVEPFDFEGVSGSLVWNTRIVECVTNGIDWSQFVVTPAGVVRGWQESYGRLEIVRSEYIWDLFHRGISAAVS
ncbi:MAG TPA: hypothetical protein VME17_26315 [Bryobacteraceae bacterium]|nr:hypothetical protein [Bryobacteraceae bacterium]